MKKILLPALSAFGLLAACSGAADAPEEEAAAETAAAADDDNDAAAPVPVKAEEDHPHDGSEGDDHKH